MKNIVLILALLLNCVYAGEIVTLNKGDIAPFSGALVDKEQLSEFRKIDEERKLLDQQNVKLKDLADIHNQRIDLYKQEVKMVRDDLSSQQRKSFWTNIGYFALGVVVTGLAAKVAIEATR